MAKDKLTELIYFDDFKEKASEIIESLKEPCILISFNISNFKYINSVYGYEKGDELLVTLAEKFIKQNEYCLIGSRVHSDRFIMLIKISDDVPMDDIANHYDAIHKRYVESLEDEFPMAVLRINSGACLIPAGCRENISELVDRAELARKSIRNDYGVTIRFYTDELEAKAKMERSIIPQFERALRNDRIHVYLQPKVEVDTQRVVGAEALARLENEDGEFISPMVFVPVLEEYGMISQLDRYVTQKVYQVLTDWKKRNMELIPISVNLSRVDFKREAEFVRILEETEHCMEIQKYIEFEVTETVLFEDFDFITNRIKVLQEKGFKVSMDDFGTGFSSLNSLGIMPVDVVKLDRGFVQHSISTKKGLEILTGLIGIFDKIGLGVICEGIETKEEEQIIRSCKCKFVQGFLHGKPTPIMEFEKKYMKQKEKGIL